MIFRLYKVLTIINSNKKAISLIESAMTLGIIACLSVGIFFGYKVLHRSQLFHAAGEINNTLFAISQFKERYNYLPGDHPTLKDEYPSATNGAATGKLTGNIFTENTPAMRAFEQLYFAGFAPALKPIQLKIGGYIGIEYIEDCKANCLVISKKTAEDKPLGFLTIPDIKVMAQQAAINKFMVRTSDGKEVYNTNTNVGELPNNLKAVDCLLYIPIDS